MTRLQVTILQMFNTARNTDLLSTDQIISHCKRHGCDAADKTIRNNLSMMKRDGLIDYRERHMIEIRK